jgi:ribose 5-phosphate isomerase B
VQAARTCRQHNNSNVLILGADYIKEKDAEKILDVWLNTEFEGGRHLRRLKQIEKFSKGSN